MHQTEAENDKGRIPAEMIVIVYTTRYREGGARFEHAATTLEAEKRAAHPGVEVIREATESKKEFIAALERISALNRTIKELHFIGHSGMYGPMFGTRSWPEQFSPYEWRSLTIPFTAGAAAWFHSCRSARWFAPFFARTFGVAAYGNHWYTSFSRRPERFVWPGPRPAVSSPLYVISCPGKKSHGLLGSVMKYSGFMKTEQIRRFEPCEPDGDASYNSVAHLYDDVFTDITVRADEWQWLSAHLPLGQGLRVLDIGCGNGALLARLAGRIATGIGVDRSEEMISHAEKRHAGTTNLSFITIDGPLLPFPDRSFDVVISFLSFRYLDWDPIMNEIRRVLVPGGRLLVVDMVTAPVRIAELPQFVTSKIRNFLQLRQKPGYRAALRRMVSDPNWKTLLKHNPIRAEHEFKWYLESRFPGKKTAILNIGWHSRVIAFDSGALAPGTVEPLRYP